jgi:hypothetical protein
MGRSGIEPATLGLKVQASELRQVPSERNILQIQLIRSTANCSKQRVVENILYAHLYARLAVVEAGHTQRFAKINLRVFGSFGSCSPTRPP